MASIAFTHPQSGANLGESFAVQRIVCIGRNYAEHTREMGNDPERDPPIFFFKPLTALNQSGVFVCPGYSKQVEHELELVVAVGEGGADLSEAAAQRAVVGFGLGLDMTCRDSQREAKDKGLPWDLAKGFDGSAPITPLVKAGFEHLQALGEMTLDRNGETCQRGHWQGMIWSIPELLMQVSRSVTLVPGDLVFTGTPGGVARVTAGDALLGRLEGLPHTLTVEVR